MATSTVSASGRASNARVAVRVVIALLVLALLVFLAFDVWFYRAVQASMPRYEGSVALAGLSQPVTVAFDAQGVPTVNAATLDDLVAGGREPALPARDGPAETAERGDDRARLAGLLAALPERYRVPVVLRHVDDLTYAELAEALGRPEGTLKAQVHRGLAMLRAAAVDAGLEGWPEAKFAAEFEAGPEARTVEVSA